MLVRSLGYRGLALGTALAALLNAAAARGCCARGWAASRATPRSRRCEDLAARRIVMALARAYDAERALHVPFAGRRR